MNFSRYSTSNDLFYAPKLNYRHVHDFLFF